jgi:hypothetical protein
LGCRILHCPRYSSLLAGSKLKIAKALWFLPIFRVEFGTHSINILPIRKNVRLKLTVTASQHGTRISQGLSCSAVTIFCDQKVIKPIRKILVGKTCLFNKSTPHRRFIRQRLYETKMPLHYFFFGMALPVSLVDSALVRFKFALNLS